MSSVDNSTRKGALCTDLNGLLLSGYLFFVDPNYKLISALFIVSGDFDSNMRDILAGRFTSILRTASKLSDSKLKMTKSH